MTLLNPLRKLLVICVLCSVSVGGIAHSRLNKYSHKTNPNSLRIFFPNFHDEVTRSLAISLGKLGHTLVLPGIGCHPKDENLGTRITPDYLLEKSLEGYANIEIAEGKDLFLNPPDIVIVWANNNLPRILKPNNLSKKKRIEFVYFTGNGSELRHKTGVKHALITDGTSEADAVATGVEHYIKWIPWIDFDDTLKFIDCETSNSIGSYIRAYENRFPEAADYFQIFTLGCTDYIGSDLKFIQYDTHIDGFDTSPKGNGIMNRKDFIARMRKHVATLHIRPFEPFGYSVLESISIGRPVFLYRPYCEGNTRLKRWCIEGETAFYFSTQEEFNEKVARYLGLPEAERKELQQKCALRVRSIINNELETNRLGAFLQRVVQQRCRRR